MRADDPVPPMPMASHLVQVIWDGIQQRFERHYEDEGQQFLLWALLHPLPDGSKPATFGAVSERLSDRKSLKREIQAITEQTGAAYHKLGMRVQFSSHNYKLFDVIVGMAADAVNDYIALPSARTYTAMIQLDREQEEGLQYTLNGYRRSEQAFLSDCLRSGIAHAQEHLHERYKQRVEADERDLTETIDDDIPF